MVALVTREMGNSFPGHPRGLFMEDARDRPSVDAVNCCTRPRRPQACRQSSSPWLVPEVRFAFSSHSAQGSSRRTLVALPHRDHGRDHTGSCRPRTACFGHVEAVDASRAGHGRLLRDSSAAIRLGSALLSGSPDLARELCRLAPDTAHPLARHIRRMRHVGRRSEPRLSPVPPRRIGMGGHGWRDSGCTCGGSFRGHVAALFNRPSGAGAKHRILGGCL